MTRVLLLPIFLICSMAQSAEMLPNITTSSRHALAPIAPDGKWIFQLEARSTYYNSMYDQNGKNQALGSDYNGVQLDRSVFPLLALMGPGASLGSVSLVSDVSVQRAQFTLGYGLSDNVTLGLIGTVDSITNHVQFTAGGGNIGSNPAFNPAAAIGPANFPFAPVGAGALQPMRTIDINSILVNPAFGYAYKPIQASKTHGLSTLLLGTVWRAYQGDSDSVVLAFGVRGSFAKEKDPDNLFDVPVDDGTTDVLTQIEYYRQMTSMFDVRLMARRVFQLSDRITARVAAPGQLLALASSKEILDRNMGDYWEYDVETGVSMGNWRISGTWHRFLKKADHYYSPRSQDVTALMQNTAIRADQWRLGVSWSGLDAWLKKEISIPLMVKFEMQDTLRGRNMGDLRDYYLLVTSFY